MRQLKNKQLSFPVTDEQDKGTYADLIRVCLNVRPEDGFDLETMRHRIKIMDKVEAANSEIELEDTQLETVKECVKQMRWTMLHKDILGFCEDVEKL